MEYKKIISSGYILGLAEAEKGNISKEEYDRITDIFHSKSIAPEGYDYRLKADLSWELYELPIVEETAYTEEQLTAMSNAELQAILADMGISTTMNKANMVRLILSMQSKEE